MKKEYCYNCGKECNAKELTREHIPAKNLFAGFESKYTENRITVSACLACNNQFSPTDEEFRNMLGVFSIRKENNEIRKKTISSIQRNLFKYSKRFVFDTFGKNTDIKFGQSTIEDYHKKNFRGLYYFQYGKILSDDYELFVNIDENDWSEHLLNLIGYLKDLFVFKYSGSKEVFEYIIQPVRSGLMYPSKQDLQPNENEKMFVGILKYCQEHAALVIAARKSWLDELERNKLN